MKNIKLTLTSLMMMLGLLATPVLLASTVHADAKTQICQGATGTDACNPKGESTNLPAFIKKIVNVLLFIIGAVSVIMIVVGGLRYVLSGGDSGAVNGAKNTILYAIVGLIVAFMAYAIVRFVSNSL